MRRRVSKELTNDQIENGLVYVHLCHESRDWFDGYTSSNTRLFHLMILLWASRRAMFTLRVLQEYLQVEDRWDIEALRQVMITLKRYGLVEWEKIGSRTLKNSYYLTLEGKRVADKIAIYLDPLFQRGA